MKRRNSLLLIIEITIIITTILMIKYEDIPFKLNKYIDKLQPLQMSQTNTYLQNTVQDDENAQPVQSFTAYNGIDLSLRMFVSKVNQKELKYTDGSYIREPVVDTETLKSASQNTANYLQPKNPIELSVGDTVEFTIRIYNEGGIDTYANSVTVHLPPQLQFIIEDDLNISYGWLIDTSLRKASTSFLEKPIIDEEDKIIKGFDGNKIDYKELKIKCKVTSFGQTGEILTTIAEITGFTAKDSRPATNNIEDRDSKIANIQLPTDEQLTSYNGNSSNKSILTDRNYFYKGQEDDDDFEKLILGEFKEPLWEMVEKTNEIPTENTEIINNMQASDESTELAGGRENSEHIILSNTILLQPDSVEDSNKDTNLKIILITILSSLVILLVGILIIKRFVLV